MYWTLELASYLSDAPWPMTKAELIDYAIRTGAPMEVVENLQAIEDEGEIYESIEEVWSDYPTDEDFLWNEDSALLVAFSDKTKRSVAAVPIFHLQLDAFCPSQAAAKH